jgi:hypothetical protein
MTQGNGSEPQSPAPSPRGQPASPAAPRGERVASPGHLAEVIAGQIRRLGPIGKAVVAIVTTASAAIPLIIIFCPGDIPFCQPPQDAEIEIVRIVWPFTMRAFEPTAQALWKEADEPPRPLTEGRANFAGVAARFSASMSGYQGKPCFVRWSILHEQGSLPLPDPAFNDRPAWPIGMLRPGNPSVRREVWFWAPLPREAGSYVLEMTLHCENEQVASATSVPFTVE